MSGRHAASPRRPSASWPRSGTKSPTAANSCSGTADRSRAIAIIARESCPSYGATRVAPGDQPDAGARTAPASTPHSWRDAIDQTRKFLIASTDFRQSSVVREMQILRTDLERARRSRERPPRDGARRDGCDLERGRGPAGLLRRRTLDAPTRIVTLAPRSCSLNLARQQIDDCCLPPAVTSTARRRVRVHRQPTLPAPPGGSPQRSRTPSPGDKLVDYQRLGAELAAQPLSFEPGINLGLAPAVGPGAGQHVPDKLAAMKEHAPDDP